MVTMMPEQPTVRPSSGVGHPVSRGTDSLRARPNHLRSRTAGHGRRWVSVPLVVALILLAAASGSDARGSSGNVQPSYAEAPCPNPIYPGIVLGPEFTCGYLTVPENRSKSDGRTIRLAVATRRATAPTPKPDPIVFLTGGPGAVGSRRARESPRSGVAIAT
jgi:hypothetical protein